MLDESIYVKYCCLGHRQQHTSQPIKNKTRDFLDAGAIEATDAYRNGNSDFPQDRNTCLSQHAVYDIDQNKSLAEQGFEVIH